jgi:uncharacterized damage-inducible protein DinB
MTRPDDLQYPVGRCDWHAPTTPASLRAAVEALWDMPAAVRRATYALDDDQLETPYRPGGWSVRQVVHHVADSHLHGYLRHKVALTESNPVIHPYDEQAWAALPDARLPIAAALAVLESVSSRWKALCDGMAESDLARTYTHATVGPLTVERHLHFFAWHGRHHVAQITTLREREGW